MIQMYMTAAGGGTNEYASTMSTHPQPGRAALQSFKTHMPKNAAASHTPQATIPKIFSPSRKFARIVSDIFVSQAMVRGGNFSDSKT